MDITSSFQREDDEPNKHRLVGSIEIDQLPLSIFEALQPLYQDAMQVEVLKHPVTGRIIFSSDQPYFLDDAHDGRMINPFCDASVSGSNIVDSVNNVVMSIQDYYRFYSALDYAVDVTAGRKHTLSRAIEQHLNGIQYYSETIDVDYLIEDADDYAVAVLNGTSQEFIQAMNGSGHDVCISGGNRWGSSTVNSYVSGNFIEGITTSVSADRLVDLINSRKKNKNPRFGSFSNPMEESKYSKEWSFVSTNSTPLNELLHVEKPVYSITDPRYDPRKSVLEEYVAPEIDESVEVGGEDLPGVIVAGNPREQYNHRVSDYQKCKLEIMRDYAFGRDARHAFQDIHADLTRMLTRNSLLFKTLVTRTNHPDCGWDVYKTELDIASNSVKIYYVHDLRIHQWTEQLSQKYTGKK